MAPSAKFTPSLLNGETLELLFTARERELGDALNRIENAINDSHLSHTLFVGPRGSGKTHLVALIQHRISSWTDYGQTFRSSWVNEDAYLIVDSYQSLLREIDKGLRTPADPDFDGLTVVLIENLDQVLIAIGPQGQRELRARLEETRDLLLVATTTSLTGDLIEQAEPFYGFFADQVLEPFTVDQAVDMLAKKAEQVGDRTLAVRLSEPDSHAKLAAIRQITGGQPRIWALLADGLTLDRLEDMADVLIERFDDLTPLYQEQLVRLAFNERRTIMTLVNADHAMTVTDLSEVTDIDVKTMASTVRNLKNKRWLKARTGFLTQYLDKRLTYYELAEPLARVYFQIKSANGEPVKLVVEFLASWFGRPGLGSSLTGSDSTAAYLRQARELATQPDFQLRYHLSTGFSDAEHLAWSPPQRQPEIVAECERLDQALSELQHHQSAAGLLKLPISTADLVEDQLVTHSVALLRIQVALIALRVGGGEIWLQHALDALDGIWSNEQTTALIAVACIRWLIGQFDTAAGAMRAAAESSPESLTEEQVNLIVSIFDISAKPAQSLALLNSLLPHTAGSERVIISSEIAYWTGRVGCVIEALRLYEELLPEITAVLGSDHPDTFITRSNIAYWTGRADRIEEALRLYEELLPEITAVLGSNHPYTLNTQKKIAYFTEKARRRAQLKVR